jgi:ketosteroid isomerase-like protein
MSSPASPAVSSDGTAAVALQAYCEHFAARRSDALVGLFADHALVEIPLLPHHVRGAEVAPTLEGIVSTLRSCDVQLRNVAGAGQTSIGEGRLEAQTDDGPLAFDFAMVVEVDDSGRIVRLSEYFDTDPIKPLD